MGSAAALLLHLSRWLRLDEQNLCSHVDEPHSGMLTRFDKRSSVRLVLVD
jgi:hypothetical protein